MRQSLEDFIRKAVAFRYRLPNTKLGIDKCCYSDKIKDYCYACTDDDMKTLIYNSIIDYAFNDNEFGETTLDEMLQEALLTRLRYNNSDDEDTQLRYGFYGEVLLNIILRYIWKTDVIICKGIFYDTTARPEEFKGFDSFHIVSPIGKQMSLWFGEAKFHQQYQSAIDSVFKNIEVSLSDDYLKKNLWAILSKKTAVNTKYTSLNNLLIDLRKNPYTSIKTLGVQYKLRLVYPIFIISHQVEDYDTTIRKIVQYINSNYCGKTFNISIPVDIFFILLPVDNVLDIKKSILEWIKQKKPMTL